MDTLIVILLFAIFCVLGYMALLLKEFVTHITAPPPMMPMMMPPAGGGYPSPRRSRKKKAKEPIGFKSKEKPEEETKEEA